jgi:hypothetical protein
MDHPIARFVSLGQTARLVPPHPYRHNFGYPAARTGKMMPLSVRVF